MLASPSPYHHFLDRRRAAQRLRMLPAPDLQAIDFTHNDYMGLSRHPALIAAAQEAAVQEGVSSRASRLLGGTSAAVLALEADIAAGKKTEAALVFATGYQANATAIAAVLDKDVLGAEPLVFTDRLIHASMHHGCQLAGVRQLRYHHNDMDHLEALLKKHVDGKRPVFILTESVFSMDGDVTDLATLTTLAQRYGCFIYLDEAHATGVMGPQGYGLSSVFAEKIDMVLGTFGKGLGCAGAYVACNTPMRDYLINRCTGFIYTTAPPPPQIAAMQAAWALSPTLDDARQILAHRATALREHFQGMEFDTGLSVTHIIPLMMPDESATLKLRDTLAAEGIRVAAIRPPTVPTPRLRISLCASHSDDDVARLCEALAKT